MTIWQDHMKRYNQVMACADATDKTGKSLDMDAGVDAVVQLLRNKIGPKHSQTSKVIFAGNGGSAGICSHMATDFNKNGKIHAIALNDSSALTCLGNDLGFDQVFAEQIRWHARCDDILILVSSSGESPNIIAAADRRWNSGLWIVTLSGFKPHNRLRQMGHFNFYLPSDNYGFVETGHAQILHAILDIHMGWKP